MESTFTNMAPSAMEASVEYQKKNGIMSPTSQKENDGYPETFKIEKTRGQTQVVQKGSSNMSLNTANP